MTMLPSSAGSPPERPSLAGSPPRQANASSKRVRPLRVAWLTAGVVLLSLASAGCEVCYNARRTLLVEPLAFSAKWDRCRSTRLYQDWADEVWAEHYADACAGGGEQEQFEAGFKDGFVDFVYAGGTGEPPPVPPRQFWNAKARNPEGHLAAEAWFEGYRQGAAIARDGGYRDRAILQASHTLACNAPCTSCYEPVIVEAGTPSASPAEILQLPQAEPLPAPPDSQTDSPTDSPTNLETESSRDEQPAVEQPASIEDSLREPPGDAGLELLPPPLPKLQPSPSPDARAEGRRMLQPAVAVGPVLSMPADDVVPLDNARPANPFRQNE